MLIKNQKLLKSTQEQIAHKEEMIRLARTSPDGACYLSLLKDTHAQYVRDLFGGMAREHFPCTVSCMERTETIAREKGLRMVTGDDQMDGWMDGIFVKAVEQKENGYRIAAGATAVHPIWEMALQVDFYILKDGKPVVAKEGLPSFSFPAEQNVEAELALPQELALDEPGGLMMTACFVGQDDILRVKVKTLEFFSFAENFDILSAIRVLDPVKKKMEASGQDEYIIVCYDRAPGALEAYDYLLYYTESDFYIPSRGQAVFADKNQRFAKALSVWSPGSSSTLSLVRKNGGGLAAFENERDKDFSQFFSLYVDPDTKLPGFQWNFKTSRWQAKNPLPIMEILEADYQLTVSYQVAGSEDVYHMMVYTGTTPKGDGKPIAPLKLYWGCLCRDTRVTMADLSVKAIQDIRPGDLVYSDEEPLRVRDLVTGKERKGVYKLTAGRSAEEPIELYLTGEHPLITDQGVRALLRIQSYIDQDGNVAFREQLKRQDGEFVPIRSLELAMVDDNVVYNLELESAEGEGISAEKGIFYANGLAVGDNQMQGYASELELQKKRQACGLPLRWKTDVATIQRYFQGTGRSVILWKK